jgi:prolyl oligopeptidase
MPAATATVVPAGPPVAAVRPVVDTYFGQQVTDDYRWMETPDSPELATWMKGQADYARSEIDAVPAHAALAARVHELNVKSGDRVWNVQVWGGRWFYMKRPASKEMGKLYVRDDLSKDERLLVDPEALASEGKHFALDWFTPSLDGKKVAYGVSPSGSEDSVLRVLDTATGKDFPESITRSQFGGVSWLDGRTFAHTRLQKLPAGAPPTEKYKNVMTYVHVLGTDPEADPAVLGPGVSPAVTVSDVEQGFMVFLPAAPRWVFGVIGDGVRNEVSVYFALRAKLAGGKTPWTKLFDKMNDDDTTYDARGKN